jgi:hypothetical protein
MFVEVYKAKQIIGVHLRVTNCYNHRYKMKELHFNNISLVTFNSLYKAMYLLSVAIRSTHWNL